MIFDNSVCTALVMMWHQYRDVELLDRILEESTGLIESVVSGYNPTDREDLIQEVSSRIIYALPHFNPRVSSLYNYLATVIRNCCITYVTREGKQPTISIDVCIDDFNNYPIPADKQDILTDLIVRNRQRFPSIEVNTVDNITKYIYNYICENPMNRKIIDLIKKKFFIDRQTAIVVYQSTIVYLRSKYANFASEPLLDTVELSLLCDVRDVLGVELYEQLLLIFSGMTIKIP